MQILFEGRLTIDYGFALLKPSSSDAEVRLIECRGGQRNGLCGAAEQGVVALTFGSTMGRLPFRVELWPAPPELDDGWEDVVEVSFVADDSEPLVLSTFDEEHVIPALSGVHRARYHVSGLDEAHDRMVPDGEEPLDRTLLQLWPDETWRPDEILRQTNEMAAYWHGVARETAAPPPLPSRAERAAAEAAAADVTHRRNEEMMQEIMERMAWGDGVPSDRLHAIGGRGPLVFRRDPELAEDLAALPADQQRSLSLWCARTAADRAGRRDHPRVRAGLHALAAGQGLPDDLATWETAPVTLAPGPQAPRVATISVVDTDALAMEPNMLPHYQLTYVLLEAADPDPGRAVLGAVEGLLIGRQPLADRDEIRRLIGAGPDGS